MEWLAFGWLMGMIFTFPTIYTAARETEPEFSVFADAFVSVVISAFWPMLLFASAVLAALDHWIVGPSKGKRKDLE